MRLFGPEARSHRPKHDRTGVSGLADTLGHLARTVRSRRCRNIAMGVLVTAITLMVVAWASARPTCPAGTCPNMSDVVDYRPPEAPHVYDLHGQLVAHLPGEVRIWTPIDSMPALLVDGYVAVEDVRFRDHTGVDVTGIARAVLANVRSGGVVEGASTITMQLARTIWAPGFVGRSRWIRKLAEVRLARQLERRLSKDRILELYLNEIYLGRGLYGVGAAARHYFGKSPAQLDVHEIATLVAMTKTPERYNPRTRPETARGRRDLVLDILAREGLLAPDLAGEAKQSPVETVTERPNIQGQSYASAAVLRELKSILPVPADRRGVRVYTTLDWDYQLAVERLVVDRLTALEGRSRYPHPVPGESMAVAGGPSPFLQAAVVVMDPRSGAVRATVGGRSFGHSEFDRVAQARRQPGSAFKPFVYAAALEKGTLTLADRIELSPIEWEDENGEIWSPRDPLAETEDDVTVRTALSRSSNIAAVRVGMEAGVRNVIRSAASYGLDSPLDPYPATLLGASGVTPLEMAVGFATLTNGGTRVTPYLIERVERPDGEVVHGSRRRAEQVLDPRSAFLTRRALEGVTAEGTGWRVRREGVRSDVVGKTGTSNGAHDLWFVGSTPAITATVWLGFDQPTPILRGDASASTIAAPLWGSVVSALEEHAAVSAARWPRPPAGLHLAEIDPETGLRVTAGCPAWGAVREEWFLPTSLPEDNCQWARIADERALSRLEAVGGGTTVAAPRSAPVGGTTTSRRGPASRGG